MTKVLPTFELYDLRIVGVGEREKIVLGPSQ